MEFELDLIRLQKEMEMGTIHVGFYILLLRIFEIKYFDVDESVILRDFEISTINDR